MSTLLEQRYRTVLRMLPASYRAHREEEMVDTYLQDFDAEEQEVLRPSWREVASIAGLAVRTRVAGPHAPHAYAVTGETVRLFALLSVLLHAARTLTDRALLLAWLSGVDIAERARYVESFGSLGAFSEALQWSSLTLPLCWAAAYAALLHDRRRAALVLSAAAALPHTVALAHSAAGDAPPATGLIAATVFAWLTVPALGCAFHEDAPPARLPLARPGLTLMAACVLMGGATVAWPYADSTWAAATACVTAGILWFSAWGRGSTHASRPALPLALALVALAVLAERIEQYGFLRPTPGIPPAMIYANWAQAALLTLLATALTAAGARLVRRNRPAADPGKGLPPGPARTR